MLKTEKGSVPIYIALLTKAENGEFVEPHPSTGYKRAKMEDYEIQEVNLHVNMEKLSFGFAKESGYGPVTHFGVYITADHPHPMHVDVINTGTTDGLFVPPGSEAIMHPEELAFRMPPVKFTKVSAKVNVDSYSMFHVH
jgi:hypothetical protein